MLRPPGPAELGAVDRNIEINEKVMVELTRAVDPALILCNKDLDMAVLVGDHPAPRLCFGNWSADGSADPYGVRLLQLYGMSEAG